MGPATAGALFAGSLLLALVLVHNPLGDYMFRVYSAPTHSRLERVVYRLVGVEPSAEHSWSVYARSVLAFSAVGIVLLFGLQLVQQHLWLHPPDPGTTMTADLAWNTAVSFVTNTDWQAYSGESTMGSLVQMSGLAVQNFLSAAVGMAVGIALVRGFARNRTGSLGNFWVDLVRGTVRILVPLAVVGAVVLVIGGVVQNFHGERVTGTLAGGTQVLPGGPVASQQAIEMLGTNGGGFYNANAAHPFANPAAWTSWVQIFLMLMIAASLPRTFGRMVGDKRQGYAIAAVMALLAIVGIALTNLFQLQHHGTVPTAVGASMEGVEQRFGVADSATFTAGATLSGAGATNSALDSYTSLGGLMAMFHMQLGEVAPGGAGSGLYGILILAVITVFVAGLMVGRTPEYLGKKITPREIKLAAAYFLVTPILILVGTAITMALPGPRAQALNPGPHGLSEVLYAFTSVANSNGSAFAGLSPNTPWYNTVLGVAMILGRLLPMIFVLALAGALARQSAVPASAGTLPTHRPQFVGLVTGVTLILVTLTFLPSLALGPLAEGIHR